MACRGEREDKKKERKKNIKEIVIKCLISRTHPILNRDKCTSSIIR